MAGDRLCNAAHPQKKPLEAGQTYVLSDAFVAFSEEVPENESAMVRQYLDLLAGV